MKIINFNDEVLVQTGKNEFAMLTHADLLKKVKTSKKSRNVGSLLSRKISLYASAFHRGSWSTGVEVKQSDMLEKLTEIAGQVKDQKIEITERAKQTLREFNLI